MSRLRRIAEIPAGSWTKWLVVGFWLVVVVVAFPLSNKLMGAEKNDASAWLPANAESTQVLDLQSHFQSPNIFPAVVVYDRASGLTAADRAKAAADARSFAGLARRRRRPGDRPDPIGGRQGHPDHRFGQPGQPGLERRGDGRRLHPRDHRVPCGRPDLSHHRSAGERGRQQQGVQGHRQHAAVRDAGGGHRDLADHLPEPGAVAAAGAFGGGGADHRRGGGVPAGGARGPDGQRAKRRHSAGAGVRRQHRLCAADRRALPGGTAPPRPAPCGDGRGAAPRGPGDHRQRQHRHRRDADAVGRGAELDQEPGPGAGDRRRGRHARHDHSCCRRCW